LASLGVSLEGRGSSQGDSVDLEPRHCVSEDTLSELDLAHASKCVLGRQQAPSGSHLKEEGLIKGGAPLGQESDGMVEG
jgi:hypothetical protein